MGEFAQRTFAIVLVLTIAAAHAAGGDVSRLGEAVQSAGNTVFIGTSMDVVAPTGLDTSIERPALLSGLGDPVFGFLFALLLASFIVGSLWRNRSGLTLSALCASALGVLLFADGFAYGVSGLRSLDAHANALLMFIALALYFASRFNRGAIGGASLSPSVCRTLDLAEWGLICVAILSLLIDKSWMVFLIRGLTVAGYVLGSTLVWVSLRSWRAGSRHALFLVAAWMWLLIVQGSQQLGWINGPFFAAHGLHIAIAGSLMLVAAGFVDGVMGYRHRLMRQVKSQQRTGDLLRVERSRRDFADEVTRLIRTLEPRLYEESILTAFLRYLAGMVPCESAAIAIAQRGDLRLFVLGDNGQRAKFEAILAAREQLLKSVCRSDLAAAIHSEDLVVSTAGDGAGCLNIVPVTVDRDEWAGVLIVRSGDRELGRDEIELVGDFARQAYDAVRNAQQFRRVRREAETDPLTGIFNRRAVLVRGERSFKKSLALARPLSVLFIDIDYFKRINDDQGHAVGDQALHLVASICSESLREDDFIGRYGGEEFLAVLPGADAGDAARVAERLRATVESAQHQVDGCVVSVTVSVGIAECGPQFSDFAELLRAADGALYCAKREGRNRVVHDRGVSEEPLASRPGS